MQIITFPVLFCKLRGCLYGGGPALLVKLALFARSRVSVKFFVKICFCLYEKRASPPWWDLAIDYRDLA